MYAWEFDEYGDYREVLKWREVADPKPAPDEALLSIAAAAINFPDILLVTGKYQFKPALPAIPGIEAVGTVTAVGAQCALKIGDRVASLFRPCGAFAEQGCVKADTSFGVPDSMPDEHAAALLTIYQTAHFALGHRGHLQAGETLLVHGGAGGVGTAAIQIGKAWGATVIATAGSSEKLEVCRQQGADHVINYSTDDFVAAVKSITDGAGADVIYDPVGGDVFDKSSKCIAWEGRLLVIGFAGGRIPEIAANRILLKNMSVIGLFWGNYVDRNPKLLQTVHADLLGMYARGDIVPVVSQVLPMTALCDGLDALETRSAYGKIVLQRADVASQH